jgi:hypothetical protein
MPYLYLPGSLTNSKIQRTETANSFYGRSLTERLGFAFSMEQIDKPIDRLTSHTAWTTHDEETTFTKSVKVLTISGLSPDLSALHYATSY